MKSILSLEGIKVLSKKEQTSVSGGYRTEGRRRSCNIRYDLHSLGMAAIYRAQQDARRCGGTYLNHILPF